MEQVENSENCKVSTSIAEKALNKLQNTPAKSKTSSQKPTRSRSGNKRVAKKITLHQKVPQFKGKFLIPTSITASFGLSIQNEKNLIVIFWFSNNFLLENAKTKESKSFS